MFKKTAVLSFIFLACVACVALAKRQHKPPSPRSLSKSELLALVAGGSLPENIVYEIHAHGLLFKPSANYTILLTNAGADPQILVAMNKATLTSGAQSEPADDSALLQHLSAAGKMLRAGQLDDAAEELTTAINTGDGKSELGFVMGIILIDKQRYEEAGQC